MQAPAYQILELGGNSLGKCDLSSADLLVGIEWYVSEYHIVEEHAETPNCGRIGPILAVKDPLWRSVH